MSCRFQVNPNEQFDDETQELYRMRPTTDQQQLLATLDRRIADRMHFPIRQQFSDEKYSKLANGSQAQVYKFLGYTAFFAFSLQQFIKAYYPYGYVLRASIPVSWATYFKHRAPIVGFMVGYW